LPKLAALHTAAGWLTVHAFGRGVRAGLSVLEIVVPVYWFSDSLVTKHHNQARPGSSFLRAALPAAKRSWHQACTLAQVFDDVFRSQYGSGPVRQLNAEQRARLAVKVQEREAVKRERASRVPITQAYQARFVLVTVQLVTPTRLPTH